MLFLLCSCLWMKLVVGGINDEEFNLRIYTGGIHPKPNDVDQLKNYVQDLMQPHCSNITSVKVLKNRLVLDLRCAETENFNRKVPDLEAFCKSLWSSREIFIHSSSASQYTKHIVTGMMMGFVILSGCLVVVNYYRLQINSKTRQKHAKKVQMAMMQRISYQMLTNPTSTTP